MNSLLYFDSKEGLESKKIGSLPKLVDLKIFLDFLHSKQCLTLTLKKQGS